VIGGVFQTVRSIDATARERESIMALGTMAAGLAHEINNPAAAILRSVESLRDAGGYMLESLVELAEDGVSANQFIALDRLRVELEAREVVDDSSIAMADREETIGEWLESHAIDHAWAMAPVFASVDTEQDWFSRVQEVVGHVALSPALRWVSSTLGSARLMAEILDATNRIAHLVKDVKSYSQMDRSALQVVDVHEGLENTLTILRAKLGDIEVIRAFEPDLPHTEVFAAELNQVWTNLIDNAIDAMDGHGTLRLVTRRERDDVVVEVIDSGAGMAPGVQARVFEPFFTTKDVGQGTGLGLSIALGIATAHGGSLECVEVGGRRPAVGARGSEVVKRGACFVLTLPAHGVETAHAALDRLPAPPAASGKRCALIVEDEPPIRALLARLVGRRDYDIVEAASCEEARAAAAAQSFDLVLCDVRLADGNGADVLRCLRERQPDLGRRFVFVTGDIGAVSASGREYADGSVLRKPFTASDLDRLLASVEIAV